MEEGLSDFEGLYTFPLTCTGGYTFSIKKEGFLAISRRLDVTSLMMSQSYDIKEFVLPLVRTEVK
jgi:hypothetical protein